MSEISRDEIFFSDFPNTIIMVIRFDLDDFN